MPQRPPRRRPGQALLLAALLAACATGPGQGQAEAPPAPGDGGTSDFYRHAETTLPEPGQMLRQEALPPEKGIAEAGLQQRILYSSRSGVDGRPIAISGQLFLPAGDPPRGGWPLLAWAHGTVGVADVCAPSWTGANPRHERYLGAWLAAGYAVVASDYEGLGTPGPHPYLDKRAEAQGVLDSARAALGAGLPLNGSVVIAGQSQGGGAALAAGGLAPSYAPDLQVAAVIATGAPYLRPGALQATGVPADRPDPGLAYAFYLALTARLHDPSLTPDRFFTPAALPLAEAAAELCVGPLAGRVVAAGLTRQAALRPGAEALVERAVLPRLAYPALRLPMPVFLGIGAADRDVAASGQLALLRDLCAAGTQAQGRLYAGLDHGGAWLASQRDAMEFAARALRGAPPPRECDPSPRPATRGGAL